jgi:hypothetical protein
MPTAQRTSAETDLRKLLRELIDLRHEVVEERNELVATWRPALRRRAFLPSAINLAYYIAPRRRDLRAHVPVIWATQVLDSFVRKGSHSRSEMTDAAMAERAECVMLNKGPFVLEALDVLNDVLGRMEAHQSKKTSRLRALPSW